MKTRLLVLWLTLFAILGCTPDESVDVGVPVSDAGPDVTVYTATPHPLGASLPIPTPTGDSGALCNVPPGQTPFWGACTGVGVTGTILPDAGVGGIWYQGDAGVPDPVGLNCATGQTILWSGGVPICVAFNDAGGGGGGGTTLPDAGQGGMWMQDGGPGVPYAVPIGATDQVLTVTNAAPNWATGIDSTGSLPIGGTSATSVTIGNTTNATGVSVDVHSGDPFNVQVGAAVVEQLAGLSTDQISLGATPATSGLIRVPSGALTIIGTHAGSTIGSDSSNDLLIQPSTGTVLIGIGSGATTLDAENGTAGLSIGISGTASAGGAGVAITGQTAGGSSNVGGSATLNSGPGTTTGASGNVILNVAAPAGTVHGATVLQEGAVGYASFSPVYAASLAPAPAATVNPSNAILYGTSPNGSCGSSATCTPGLVIVNLSSVGGTGSPTEPYFAVNHANSTQFAVGAYPGQVGTYAGIWLGPGITPSTSNWSFLQSATATYMNAPSSGTLYLEVGSNQEMGITATGASMYLDGAGGLGLYNWVPSSGTRNTQTGTETRSTYYLRTAATTTATIATIAVPASGAIMIHAKIVGRLAAAAFTPLACISVGTFANNGGTVSQAGSTTAISAQGLTCAQSISGASINVTVFGQTSTTTDFQATIDTTTN